MEKIFSFSAQAKNVAYGFNHFICNILSCMVLSLVITCHEFSSSFSPLVRAILQVFGTSCKKSDAETSSNVKKSSGHEIVDNEDSLDDDVEIVLDTIMSFCNSSGDRNIDKVELADVLELFDEREPSLEEVKEAFNMFDENGDGYIDANELKNVICKFGFLEFSVEDCQRMVLPFDDNRDGKIEFCEFVKLMEQSAFQ